MCDPSLWLSVVGCGCRSYAFNRLVNRATSFLTFFVYFIWVRLNVVECGCRLYTTIHAVNQATSFSVSLLSFVYLVGFGRMWLSVVVGGTPSSNLSTESCVFLSLVYFLFLVVWLNVVVSSMPSFILSTKSSIFHFFLHCLFWLCSIVSG